ncbi:MAG TPA: lipoyl synthase [bacterium]|nr:lipoyl synthase [bacterium]HQL62908.1 lipoyl synthase [bacterium]
MESSLDSAGNLATLRKPPWIKAPLSTGTGYATVRSLVDRNRLHTVCQSARCPNIALCWSNGTGTFLILGSVCTRSCRFCAVKKGHPNKPDPDESSRTADAVNTLGLNYAVITSVTRDDLPDGGASVFAETMRAIRTVRPDCRIELLIPDFAGSMEALDIVLNAGPDVLNHNVETVPRLYPLIRPSADWNRSLEILRHAARKGFLTKSGLMVGLGESRRELTAALTQIAAAGVHILTIGQYLAPTSGHHPVERYVAPEEFEDIRAEAQSLGFRFVVAGPLVRSSYRAEEAWQACLTADPS